MALTTVTGSLVSVNAIQGTLIADNAITAVHIATNAVSGTLIADNAVTAVHIAQNTITVTQLADDCVESDKIADGIITTNHLNKAMISSQTEVTAATGDFVLLGDTSDSNNLKKTPVSSIVNLASGTTINNNANNRVITGSGTANTLEGESTLTYDGLHLGMTSNHADHPSDANVLQLGGNAVIQGKTATGAGKSFRVMQNVYDDASAGLSYISTDEASHYTQVNGTHSFNVAASGNADAAISFTEAMKIHSSGVASFNNGIELGSGVDATAANILDDYEEGTWTPAFYTYSGVTTSSMTVTLATYTKIGNICHIHANVNATLSSLPGQTVTITGLPFAASGTDQYAIIAVGGHTANTGGNTPKAHFRTNGSQLDGVYYNASNNTAFWTYQSFDSPTFHMSIHGHYHTT